MCVLDINFTTYTHFHLITSLVLENDPKLKLPAPAGMDGMRVPPDQRASQFPIARPVAK